MIIINTVVLIGRVAKDIELQYAAGTGTAVAKFTVAVNRDYKVQGQPEADFIPCVVFGKIAETVANYSAKGKQIGVKGRIQVRSWDAQDGSKRYATEVIADKIDILEWANSNSGQQGNSQSQSSGQGFGGGFDDNFTSPYDDSDEVPF